MFWVSASLHRCSVALYSLSVACFPVCQPSTAYILCFSKTDGLVPQSVFLHLSALPCAVTWNMIFIQTPYILQSHFSCFLLVKICLLILSLKYSLIVNSLGIFTLIIVRDFFLCLLMFHILWVGHWRQMLSSCLLFNKYWRNKRDLNSCKEKLSALLLFTYLSWVSVLFKLCLFFHFQV